MTLNSIFSRLSWITVACVMLAILAPLSYLPFSQEWLYPHPLSGDSFSNLSLSLHYDWPKYQFDHYKAGRVSWLIPLYFLTKLVGLQNTVPIVTVVGWILIGSLYFFLLKSLFPQRKVFLFFPWIIFFPFLIGRGLGGGVYQNYGAIIYFLLSLLVFIFAIRRKSNPGIIITGFFVASTISSNILFLNMMLFYPVLEYYLEGNINFRRYRWIVVGLILGIIFWGLFNTLFGRPFLFFIHDMKFSSSFLLDSNLHQPWHLSFSGFLIFATRAYLGFFLSCYFCGIIELFIKAGKSTFRELIFTWNYVFLFTLWLFWHAIGQPALFPVDFIYPLQLPAFLMLASWVKEKELRKEDFIVYGATILTLWLANYYSHLLKVVYHSGIDPAYLSAIFFILSLIFIFYVPRTRFSHIPYFLSVALSFGFSGLEPRYAGYQCRMRSESYKLYNELYHEVLNFEKDPGRVYFYSQSGEVKIDRCEITQLNFRLLTDPIWNIIGTSLTKFPFTAQPEEISEAEFRHDSVKVILYKSHDFVDRVIKRGQEFDFDFKLLQAGHRKVINVDIKYDIFKVRKTKNIPLPPPEN